MDIDQSTISSCSDNSESEQLSSDTDLLPFCENTIFIDLRGFRSNFGRFICKEFCLIDSDGSIYQKFIKASFPMTKLKYCHQVKVEYHQKYGHRIPYDYGQINIIELITDTIDKFNSNKTILVRDKVDQRNLQYIFRNYCQFNDDVAIITLNDLDFDPSTISGKLDLLPYCDFHNEKYGWTSGPCAKNIALKLQHTFAESRKKTTEQAE